ncbi:hypothetical protein [Pseudofrankia sp. DC12]|uniref:hypothetical protein n=1 Tax=Pseudofrankia sp. DC12 TaxID=683315 RepID=UPI0012FCE53C|nr:hypothetical protein [Pseudofrankia sp. DC12]
MATDDADGAAIRSDGDVDIADAETLTSLVLDRGRLPWLGADAGPARPGLAPAPAARPGPAQAWSGPARPGPVPGRPDLDVVVPRPAQIASAGEPRAPHLLARTPPDRPSERPRPARPRPARRHRLSYGEVALLAAAAGIVLCLAGMCAVAAWQRAGTNAAPKGLLPSVAGPGPSPTISSPGASAAPSARLAPTPELLRAAGWNDSLDPRPSLADGSVALEADRAATRSGDPREPGSPAVTPAGPGSVASSAAASTPSTTVAPPGPATTPARSSADATPPPASPRRPATSQPGSTAGAAEPTATRPTATATRPVATTGPAASARPSPTGSPAATPRPVTDSASAAASAPATTPAQAP